MSARYIMAVNGARPAEAARIWATVHASAARLPLVTVRVEPDGARERHAAVPGSERDAILLHGPVSHALAEFVRDRDVLVLGTDKTGFIHARVFGARGIQIASTVRCSVAVVPEIDLRFRSGVVAGIDRDETAVPIARTAAAEAAARAEPLQLIHSSHAGVVPAEVGTAGSVLALAASAVKDRWPDLLVRPRATARPPAEALLDASRNAALLVLGPGSTRSGAPFGSVIHDVLVNVNAPVLIVRPGTPESQSSLGRWV